MASSPVRPAARGLLAALALLFDLRLAVVIAVGLGGALAGCKSQVACNCPAPAQCDENGACTGVPDAGVPDLAVATCTPACSAPTARCNAQHQCVACLVDADCGLGQICQAGALGPTCVPGCASDAGCATGQSCCAGACVDEASDAAHCGGCGKACSAMHATAACVASACQTGACDAGWGDCDKDPSNGCEANLRIDPANCTACGMSCAIPNSVTGCSDGCYSKACQFGFDDCDGDPKNGCETSVATDPANCGACGTSCKAPAHAKAACVASSCIVTSCDQGFADCDHDGTNGCEVQTATDAANCGACGNACAQGLRCVNGSCTCQQCNIANAQTQCVNNQCVFVACVAGYADCNNNIADGCEVNLGSDPKNCSMCGQVCPMATPSCANGNCVVGVDYGPVHTFNGLSSTHYITQGCCSTNNCNGNIDDNAVYFCTHFYGQRLNMTCTPKPGYSIMTLVNCADPKMHKNGGCTTQGTDIANTTCDANGGDSACKIGNWSECTTGITNLVCHCM